MGGLLDRLLDQAFMAQLDERRQLVATLADRFGCSKDAAEAWLEATDDAALAQANRILQAAPYTDIPVVGSYH